MSNIQLRQKDTHVGSYRQAWTLCQQLGSRAYTRCMRISTWLVQPLPSLSSGLATLQRLFHQQHLTATPKYLPLRRKDGPRHLQDPDVTRLHQSRCR